ncbi:MAG TPA: hypothetical protein VGC20_05875 [bacterium]
MADCLYDFARFLREQRQAVEPPAAIEHHLDALLAVWEIFGDLTVDHAVGLAEPEFWCLEEALKQYVTFLVIADHLRFPPDFLSGTSSGSLGGPLRAYIAENRWPFPQQLPH